MLINTFTLTVIAGQPVSTVLQILQLTSSDTLIGPLVSIAHQHRLGLHIITMMVIMTHTILITQHTEVEFNIKVAVVQAGIGV